MKIHILNNSLLALALSSTVLFAGTSVSQQSQMPAPFLVPGVFTERDAGTPISVPMNGRLHLSLATDSTIDPLGSAWVPSSDNNFNFQFISEDITSRSHIVPGKPLKQISESLFSYKPCLVGPTQISFDLVKLSSDPDKTSAPTKTIIRRVTFPVTVEAANENSPEEMAPSSENENYPSSSLSDDLSTGSW